MLRYARRMPLGRMSHMMASPMVTLLYCSVTSNLDSAHMGKVSSQKRCLVCVSAYKGLNVPWCLVGPLDGRLVSHGPSHRRACLSGYTDLGMETGLVRALRSRVFLVEHRTFDMSARDERRMWITCRWLNLSVN